MPEPPSLAGAENETLAERIPGVTTLMAGALGTSGTVTLTPPDTGPVPALFTAATVQATVLPLGIPKTETGDDWPLDTALPQVTM